MKCFVGFFLIVLVSLVLSAPDMNHTAHAPLGYVHEHSVHEKIHVVEQPSEGIVQAIPQTTNASASHQNATLVASSYSNASVQGVPYTIEVPQNESGGQLGSYMKIHENCSHCINEINASVTKQLGCMCALFNVQHPLDNEPPLLTTTIHNVSCHESVPSREACEKVCVDSAKTHSDLEDHSICSKVRNATKIKVYLQSKICENGTTSWNFTGLSSKEPVCCNGGEVIKCKH